MRKYYVILLLIGLAISLNACGKKEEPKKPEEQATTEQQAKPEEQKTGQESLPGEQPAVPEEIPQLGAAADFTLPKLDGTNLSLNELKGKVIILDFWATWCPPCRKMIPDLQKLYTRYKDQGLEVVGISLDEGSPESVKSFVENVKIDYHIVLGNREVSKAYGQINAIPTTFIIDKEGMIRDKHIGFQSEQDMEAVIKPLLGK